MKQGSASKTTSGVAGGAKREPIGHSVPPAYTDQLGNMRGNHVTGIGDIPFKTTPMHQGQTLKAPLAGSTCHPSGSQGKR